MKNKIVHYSKMHHGFLVRLVQVKEKFMINVFCPKGAFYSFPFQSLGSAKNFLASFINSLNYFFKR